MKKTGLFILITWVMLFTISCNKREAVVPAANDLPEVVSKLGDTKEDDDADIEAMLENMSDRDKVEQMMLVSYRNWNESDTQKDSGEEVIVENVTQLNDEIRSDIKEHKYGGILLYGENFVDAPQTVNLISDMQRSNQEGGGIPLLVTVDQEGGSVARISFGTSGPGNMALAATKDPENAKIMAGIYGEELSLLGINTDHAPVADINNNPDNPIIGVRSFSDSPEVVSEYVLSYIEGLHDAGIISSIKHFPGHGNTDTDSHTGFPCIDLTYDELRDFELIPFKSAIDAGADMVMTAHIQYPLIETGTYTSTSTGEEVYIPSTMSHRILTDILRGDLGFEGVIVTDALGMKAISDNFAPEDVMYMTMNAGADLLMLPPVYNYEDLSHMREMTETAVKLVEEGKVDKETINDAVRRILKLKKKYKILDQTDFEATDERIKQAQEGVGSSEHKNEAWSVANKALTLVKNDNNAFPIKMSDKDTTLILFSKSCADRIGAGKLAVQMLNDRKMILSDTQTIVMVNDADNEEECIKAAKEADHCILVSRTYNKTCLDPEDTKEGFSTKVFDRIISSRHDDKKQVIVVSCQLPYDAARFKDADAILVSYNSTTMNEIPPEMGAGSAYAPNLTAALLACFGDGTVSGCLPVSIPEMDENYRFTNKILFESAYGSDHLDDDTGSGLILGDERFDEYIPLLLGKRVALFSNHTGIVGDKTSISGDEKDEDSDLVKFGFDRDGNEITYGPHILDVLLEKGVDVTAIFCPEHGFRGTEDAGANISDSVDEKTGVPILSLYQNNTHYPSKESMDKFDTLVVDMQDVGLRYYTYYISMYYLMDACASSGKDMIILDRPNPNGFYVDGPVLKEEYKSGVGQLPIPVVYGMTWGELAQMINGEGWLKAGKDACDLTVVPCLNYSHSMKTKLIRRPSPNLKDMRSVYLYASTCFFENTFVSVGRGTDMPFEVYGSPYLPEDKYTLTFVPKSMDGAASPPFEGETCYGMDLRDIPIEAIWEEGINIEYLIDAYNDLTEAHPDMDFFAKTKNGDKYWIDLLSGSDELRKQICSGKSAQEIKASWQKDIDDFKQKRQPYLLYD